MDTIDALQMRALAGEAKRAEDETDARPAHDGSAPDVTFKLLSLSAQVGEGARLPSGPELLAPQLCAAKSVEGSVSRQNHQ